MRPVLLVDLVGLTPALPVERIKTALKNESAEEIWKRRRANGRRTG